jgi:imidazolonepropionase
MSRAVVVVNCSQVVTLRGPARARVGAEMSELGITPKGALLAVDGLIRAVRPWVEIRSLVPSDALHVDAGGRIVLPGFVDAHTHLIFAGNRVEEFELRSSGTSYQEIAASGGGILSTVRKTREASIDELVTAGRKHLDWMVRAGTTTVEAKSGYGLTIKDELKILLAQKRLNDEGPVEIVSTALAAHAVPEFGGDAVSYVREVAIPVLRRAKEEGLAEFADAFVEKGYFDEVALQPYFEEAQRLGLGLRLHVDQLSEFGGASLAARWSAATADHLEQTGVEGIEALGQSGVIPVLLAGSVFGLGKTKYPDARLMIDAGLPVVLATDFNPGSSPVSSMGMVMSLACRYMNLSPAEALTASTVNAAYSLNRGDRGSLEPGKRADFVIHEAEDYREIPYWVGRETAWRVFVKGVEVLTGP